MTALMTLLISALKFMLIFVMDPKVSYSLQIQILTKLFFSAKRRALTYLWFR